MKIKTFYSKTMAEAFKEIKTHLGPDAVLLSAKEIPQRSGVWGHSSGFEVVAACDDTETIDIFPGSEGYRNSENTILRPDEEYGENLQGVINSGTYSPSKFANKGLVTSHGQSSFEKGFFQKEEAVSEKSGNDSWLPFSGRVATRLWHDLIDGGVNAPLAKKLISTAWDKLTPGQRRSRSTLIRSVARAALSMIPAIPDRDGMPEKKVVAFVGPTGVGKTTSIAKLAAQLALKKRKKVLLVTTDGYRIGAIDQLRTYAGLMG